MKKQILNLGKALNKTEQKTINGGGLKACSGKDIERCVPRCMSGTECMNGV